MEENRPEHESGISGVEKVNDPLADFNFESFIPGEKVEEVKAEIKPKEIKAPETQKTHQVTPSKQIHYIGGSGYQLTEEEFGKYTDLLTRMNQAQNNRNPGNILSSDPYWSVKLELDKFILSLER